MAVTEPAVGSTNWGPVLNAALTQLDTIGASAGASTQTLAVNGAVTINASTGQWQKITLGANATSSSITNAATGQILVIQWTQDGTGGRTYAWPANILWQTGAAPSASKGANKTDIFRFVFDGANWVELSALVGLASATFTPTATALGSTSPPAPVVAASSTDIRGSVTFGSGTAPTAGPTGYCTINYGQTYAVAPVVNITPTTGPAAALNDFLSAQTTTGFTIGFSTTIGTSQVNTTYGFAWQVLY